MEGDHTNYSTQKNAYEDTIEDLDNGRFNLKTEESDARDVRKYYFGVLDSVKANRKRLASLGSSELSSILVEANGNFEKVKRAAELTLDSRLIVTAADIGAEKVSTAQAEIAPFSLENFQTLLLKIAESERQLWALPNSVHAHWLGIQPSPSLASAFKHALADIPTSERRPRRARQDTPPTVPIVADGSKLVPDSANADKDTTLLVIDIFRQLYSIGELPFYVFVVDPRSYAKTVENLFHTSFLLSDNRATIFTRDGVLIIKALEGDNENREKQEDKKQHIMVMSMSLWKDVIKKYNIRSAAITSR